MDSQKKTLKYGMAMTQAFTDVSQYNDDIWFESKSSGYQIKKLKEEINDLK